jgi:allantoinase
MVASDHSPAPPSLKQGDDFFAIWGGISGCQSLLPALLTEGHQGRGLPLTRVAAITAGFAARRFRLPAKGTIAVGADADLALVDLDGSFVLGREDLRYRHRQSPFVGRRFAGSVVRTILRGRTTWSENRIASPPIGRLVSPARWGER